MSEVVFFGGFYCGGMLATAGTVLIGVAVEGSDGVEAWEQVAMVVGWPVTIAVALYFAARGWFR